MQSPTAFDEKNPAKTFAALAKINEVKAQKFLSELPLTDLIAVCLAMQNNDIAKINAIVGKNKLKEEQYHEAIDLKVANELRKISQASPHQNTVASSTTNAANTTVPSAASIENAASSNVQNTTVGTTGNTSTVTPTQTGMSAPTGTAAAAMKDVVSADSKTGTVAIKNPQTKKVEIKSVKDPKQSPEILALIKSIGL